MRIKIYCFYSILFRPPRDIIPEMSRRVFQISRDWRGIVVRLIRLISILRSIHQPGLATDHHQTHTSMHHTLFLLLLRFRNFYRANILLFYWIYQRHQRRHLQYWYWLPRQPQPPLCSIAHGEWSKEVISIQIIKSNHQFII